MAITIMTMTERNQVYVSLNQITKPAILTKTVIVPMALVVMRMVNASLNDPALKVFTEQMMMRQVAVWPKTH